MPLPLLLIPAIGAALYGAYKGTKAVSDNSDANDANATASSVAGRATQSFEEANALTTQALESYGRRKFSAYNGNIKTFIGLYEQLKNVALSQAPGLNEIKLGAFDTNAFQRIKDEFSALESAGVGLGAGLTGGAAAAFGAYSGTMMFATASTGTAIGSLSGAAATKATLAWLGGGAIASGGGGVALGTAVLGGLVAGPALAIAGYIMGNNAESALNKAKANLEEARTYKQKVDVDVAKLKAIQRIATSASNVLSTINNSMRKANGELEGVIASHGVDWASFGQDQKNTVFKAVKLVQLAKAMIDTAILDSEGSLIESAESQFVQFDGMTKSL